MTGVVRPDSVLYDTTYKAALRGDTLRRQGQLSRGTDHLIIEHVEAKGCSVTQSYARV
jgi:hypothetical protein